MAASLPGTPRPGSTNGQVNHSKASGTLGPPGVQQAIEPDTHPHRSARNLGLKPGPARKNRRSPRVRRQLSTVRAQLSDKERNIFAPVHALDAIRSDGSDGKRSILVRYGDTLENLALQHLGSRNALNMLIEANPQITDINKIFPGQKIYLSDGDEPSARPLSPARVASRPSIAYPNDSVRNDASNAVAATQYRAR